jgi:iron complex outermembrane receptor protein
MKLNCRQRLMATTILIGAATIATPGFAQSTDESVEPPLEATADPDAGSQDPGAEGQEGEGEEIVITGSRIARRDLTSTSPLVVVQDEEFQLSGSANAEQVLATLPQVGLASSGFDNNPGGGVATINLRGLGFQRNLVLVNGRRYIFYDTNQVVDINSVPTFLIDSTDVVTGGASAVYGSDAIAGVVNFRLRTDLEGVLIGGSQSITEEGDGHRYNINAAIGTTFADGRGHVVAYGEYYSRSSIFQDDRAFSEFALGDGDGELIPLGSASVPQGRHTAPASTTFCRDLNDDGDCTDPGEINQTFEIAANTNFNASLGGAFFQTPGTSIPYCGAPCSYNYAPANYLMVPQERWSLGGYGEYEIAEGVSAYGEVTFINNRVDNELAATPISQALNVNLDAACGFVSAADCAELREIAANQQAANAFAAANGFSLPFGPAFGGAATVPVPTAEQVRITANYRFTQISNRVNRDDRNAFRVLAGFRGEIVEDLNYDVYYMHARTKNSQIQEGNVLRSAFFQNAEDLTCNVFGLNQLSEECLDAVSVLAQNQEESTLQVAVGSISGSLFQIPMAQSPVGFAAGLEYRKMEGRFIPDSTLASGDVAGFNAGDPTAGSYDVKEVFGELLVPIIQDGFVHRFELNAAARYSDYALDNVGGVPTYSVGAELAPIPDITFRGQYQRAIRAPNVQELFQGQAVGFPPATDPCATEEAITNATLRDLCIATGVPAGVLAFDAAGDPLNAAIQPNPQIEGLFGGNPNLQEEVSDTWTFGAVLRPRFIPGLNATIDYYNIKVDNAIAPTGGGVGGILDLCYNIVQNAGSPVCGLINRDASGSLSGGGQFIVTALNDNLAGFETSGIDFQLDYMTPVNFGLLSPSSRLSFYFFGNRTLEFLNIRAPGDPGVECAGRFGLLICGEPTPKWKWTSRLSWLDGPLTTSLRWRHLGKMRDDDPGTEYVVDELDAYNLFDLAFALNVTDNATMTFGINNLFDKTPQLIGDNQQQANTYPNVYDVIGRDYFVSVNFRL